MLYLSGVIVADLPAMVTPRMRQRPPEGVPWAADNGRFASPEDYDDGRYLAWLATMPRERCLFATAPDVVADARATLDLSAPMLRPIRDAGYRVALVAQDGLERLPVPWDHIDALFIGGSTAWKTSEAAHDLADEAKRRGLWLHMGRVNGRRRFRLAAAMGCDSVDGTHLRFDPTTGRADLERWAHDFATRPSLWRS